MAERPSSLRTQEKGSQRQLRQNGRVVGKTTGWSLGHHRASCSYDGHPCQSHGQELRGIEPSSHHDSRHQPHQLTSTSPSSKTQAQGASIPFADSPFDDSYHLHFDPLHHDSQHPSFSGLSHHPNTHDGADNPPWSSTQSQAEVNFGRVCRSSTPAGHHSTFSQPVFQTIFPASEHLHPVYPHPKHATQVLPGLCNASHSRSRIQQISQIFPTHPREIGPSRTGTALLARTWQFVYLGSDSHLYRQSGLSQPRSSPHSRMATSIELPLHLPVLPSKEGSSQETPPQYQRTIWPCHPLASCQTQIHSTTGSPSLDVITVSKPSRTLDHRPRLRIKY